MAAGPLGPCSAASTVAVQVTMYEPPNEQRKAPPRVAGKAVSEVNSRMPRHTMTSPTQIIVTRPNRLTRAATVSALRRAPTASAVPCSPATVRVKPCSSRSSVSAGPKP